MAALALSKSAPVAAAIATGGVAYEAELEIAPTRLHDVEAWLPGHVAEILKLPGFQSVESFRLGETADGWIRRKNVYRVASREHLEHYLENVAPEMSARLRASFGDQVRATRRILLPAPLADSLPMTLPATATGASCMNCGIRLTGMHCHHCGQRHVPHLHSLPHFLREATENLTHADSRLWRTLWALVAKPGALTREFIDGRRASYLPPVRLYLVISLAFFLVIGTSTFDGDVLRIATTKPESATQLERAAAQIEGKVAAGATSTGGSPATAASQIKNELATELAADLRAAATEARRTTAAAVPAPIAKPEDPAQWCDRIAYGGPWKAAVEPRLRAGCRKSVLDSGAALKSEFVHQMPRAMFVLLPLIALFMLLMYWRPRRYYVEHLLFFVHTHSALFLIVLARLALAALPTPIFASGLFDLVIFAYFFWYIYAAMRHTYGQSRVRTAGKFVVLGFLYVSLASAVVGFTMIYSVAAL